MGPKVAVEQIDPETGKRVGTFPSCSDAARALDRVPSAIIMAVNSGKISGGYFWRKVKPKELGGVMKRPSRRTAQDTKVGRSAQARVRKRPAAAPRRRPAAARRRGKAADPEPEEEADEDDSDFGDWGRGSIVVLKRPYKPRQTSVLRQPGSPLDADVQGGIVEEEWDEEEEEAEDCAEDERDEEVEDESADAPRPACPSPEPDEDLD